MAGARPARLNYRRFFDVTTLIAVRVEDPDVFDAHPRAAARRCIRPRRDRRLPHRPPRRPGRPRAATSSGCATPPATPGSSSRRSSRATSSCPTTGACAGTTGYDALLRVSRCSSSTPPGPTPLDRAAGPSCSARDRVALDDVVAEAKRLVVDDVLAAEVDRLMRLVRASPRPRRRTAARPRGARGAARRDGPLPRLRRARPRRRPPSRPRSPSCEPRARAGCTAAEPTTTSLEVVVDARARHAPARPVDSGAAADEFVVRFQQTCGPVMAKGDRGHRVLPLRPPGRAQRGRRRPRPPVDARPTSFHACARGSSARAGRTSMTTLSTHDTKRSEDVRARLVVLAEDGEAGPTWVRDRARRWPRRHRADELDAPTEYLLWQTLVGTWPISEERLAGVRRSRRSARPSCTRAGPTPDDAYEAAVARLRRRRCSATRDRARHVDDVDRRPTSRRPRAQRAGAEAAPADPARRPRRLPGHRARRRSRSSTPTTAARSTSTDRGEPARPRLDATSRPADLDDEKLRVTAARAARCAATWPGVLRRRPTRRTPRLRTTSAARRGLRARRRATGRGRDRRHPRSPGRLADDGRLRRRHRRRCPAGAWHDVLSDDETVVDGGGVRLADLLGAPTPAGRAARAARTRP